MVVVCVFCYNSVYEVFYESTQILNEATNGLLIKFHIGTILVVGRWLQFSVGVQSQNVY